MRYETVIKCSVWVTKEFKVDSGPHQQSALSSFLLTMQRLTDEICQKTTWTKMFTDDTVICSDSRDKAVKAALKNRYIFVYLHNQ